MTMITAEAIENRRWNLRFDEKKRILNYLLACPCISDNSAREMVVRQLPQQIFRAWPRNSRSDIDVQNLIDTCLNSLDDGLERLIEVVYCYDGNAKSMIDLGETLQTIRPQPVPLINLLRLKSILERSIPGDVFQECHSCIPTTIRLAKVYRESDGGEMLNSLLDDLANRGRLSNGSAPLLWFLECLIQKNIIKQSTQRDLRAWVDEVAQSLNVDMVVLRKSVVSALNAASESHTAKASYLLIRIGPHDPYALNEFNLDQLFVKAWFFLNEKVGISLSTNPTDEQTIPLQRIPELLGKFIDEIRNRFGVTILSNLTVEFLLPRQLLCYNINQWKIKVGRTRTESINTRFRTVVRSYDRMYDPEMKPTWDLWYEKWSEYLKLLQNPPVAPFRFVRKEDSEQLDSFYLRLKKRDAICLILSLAPSEVPASLESDILFAALEAGTPIALWSRQNIDGLENMLEEFEIFLSAHPTHCWLDLIREKREEAMQSQNDGHLGRYLVLLWDDFDRLPPDVDASSRLRAPYEGGVE